MWYNTETDSRSRQIKQKKSREELKKRCFKSNRKSNDDLLRTTRGRNDNFQNVYFNNNWIWFLCDTLFAMICQSNKQIQIHWTINMKIKLFFRFSNWGTLMPRAFICLYLILNNRNHCRMTSIWMTFLNRSFFVFNDEIEQRSHLFVRIEFKRIDLMMKMVGKTINGNSKI